MTAETGQMNETVVGYKHVLRNYSWSGTSLVVKIVGLTFLSAGKLLYMNHSSCPILKKSASH